MTDYEKYKIQFSQQDTFTNKLHSLFLDLLILNKIEYHIIEKRTKTLESFQEKIERKNNKYLDPLTEITDLSGLRVILYYHDDSNRIVSIIKKEFKIDEENSNYKNKIQNPSEFGYSSTHIVISLDKARLNLPEWQLFSNLKAEIQIRSVLQHAWSSISHALQYKSTEDVPNKLQRQLFRLAGLFELADEEFSTIRDKHFDLLESVNSVDKIETSNLNIDLLTIEKYIKKVDIVEDIFITAIESGFSDGSKINSDNKKRNYSDLVSLCHKLEIKKIKDLHLQIIDIKEQARNIFTKLMRLQKVGNKRNPWFTTREFCIILLIIKQNVEKVTKNDLVTEGWSSDTAIKVLKAFKE